MNIKDLEYFIAVCNHGSILAAAQSLSISQQALSKSIKKLEATLDTPLLSRSANGFALTAEGEYLYEKSSIQLAQFKIFQDDIKHRFSSREITLKVGISPGILRSLGSDFILDFLHQHPHVKLELMEHFDTICESLVTEENLDLALSVKPLELKNIEFIALKNEPLYVIFHKEFLLWDSSSISFSDLKDIPIVICSKQLTLNPFVIQECAKYNFTPNFTFEINEIEVVLNFVSNKKGINICAEHVAHNIHDPNIIALPLTEATALWEIGILTKRGKIHTPELHAFIEHLTHSAATII